MYAANIYNTSSISQNSAHTPLAQPVVKFVQAEITSLFFPFADVNECEVYKLEGAPRLCMHTCINIPGSYRCSCPRGYQIFSDGKSCEGDFSMRQMAFRRS